MKGTLKNKEGKWVVQYFIPPTVNNLGWINADSHFTELPLHLDDIKLYETGLEMVLKTNREVEFEIIEDFKENKLWGQKGTGIYIKYAKLIKPKQGSFDEDGFAITRVIDNKQELENYNRLCAEFLGYEFDELSETYETPHLKLVELQAFGDEQFSCKLKIYELEFHSDWNWIMEVVDAIEKLGYNRRVDVDSSHVLIQYKEWYTLVQKESKKEAVVEAINQFLKWYNENK